MRQRSSHSLARLLVVGMVIGGAAMMLPTAANAEAGGVNIRSPHSGDRSMQLDVHAGFSHFGLGVAAGARFSIPIMDNGFVRSINNAVYINFGGDFYWVKHGSDYSPAVGIPITLNWEFTFSRTWSLFAELGVNVYLHPRLFKGDGWDWSPGHWVIGAIGARLHFNDNIALVLRLGNPYSAFGVTFSF